MCLLLFVVRCSLCLVRSVLCVVCVSCWWFVAGCVLSCCLLLCLDVIVCCWLCVVCWFGADCLLVAVVSRFLLFVVGWSLVFARGDLSVVVFLFCRRLSVVCCLLLAGRCLLFVDCSPLFVVCGLLSVVCLVLFVVRGLLCVAR